MLAAKIGLVAAAYLLGSVSFAIVVARGRGVDIREEGSANPGATNVGRVLGKGAGRTVLLLDILKGLVPASVAHFAWGLEDPFTAGTAVAAVVGHIAPIWHGFRGGKGAATAGGVLLATVPAAGVGALAIALIAKKVTGHASIGSMLGALTGALVTMVMTDLALVPTAMVLAILLLVIVRHTSNIRRLLRGEEAEET